MNRDMLLAVSCSLVVHGFVLWIGAHLQQEASKPLRLPTTLDLSIVKRSIHRTASQGSGAKPTPPLPSPKLATMSPRASRDAVTKSLTQTPEIDMSNTLKKRPNPRAIPAPQPIRENKAILKKLEVPKKIPKHSTLPAKPVTEAKTADPVAPAILQKSRRPRSEPATEREDLMNSPSDSPVARSDRSPMDKTGTETTHQASLPDQEGSPIVEAVPDYAVNPKPVYPKLAIRRNYEGTVILLVEVLPEGSAKRVEILQSSGHSVLDRSAMITVREWRFKPGTRDGKPTAMKVKVPVVFRLKEQDAG